MLHDVNWGKEWKDLHLNGVIISQSWAWGIVQEGTDLLKWMWEMCCWGNEVGTKMVTGEQAFQFTHLVMLELWEKVKKERTWIDWLVDKLIEFKDLKFNMKELTELNLDLQQRVCWLEKRVRCLRRGVGLEESMVRGFSLSPIWGLKFKKTPLWSGGGGKLEERPYIEEGLLSVGVYLVPEASGSNTPAMMTAPFSPPSINNLN